VECIWGKSGSFFLENKNVFWVRVELILKSGVYTATVCFYRKVETCIFGNSGVDSDMWSVLIKGIIENRNIF